MMEACRLRQPDVCTKLYLGAWAVEGRRAVTGAVVTNLPMCGRADERDVLVLAWNRVATGVNGSQIVVISGEAGIGKSRLVAEVVSGLSPEPACILAGRARTHAPAPYDWMASA